MSSIDFDLVRETARTNWREPELPWGGIPEITAPDVQQALSRYQISHPFGAFCLKAKYCDSDHAAHMLGDWMRKFSVNLWGETRRLESVKIEFYSLHRCGELAVLYYLLPRARQREPQNNSLYCQCSKAAWVNHLSDHHAFMWNKLNDVSTQAVREVRRFLYQDDYGQAAGVTPLSPALASRNRQLSSP